MTAVPRMNAKQARESATKVQMGQQAEAMVGFIAAIASDIQFAVDKGLFTASVRIPKHMYTERWWGARVHGPLQTIIEGLRSDGYTVKTHYTPSSYYSDGDYRDIQISWEQA